MQKFPQKYSTQLRLGKKGAVQICLPVDNSYMFIYDEQTKINYQEFDGQILLIGSKTELIPVYELNVNEHYPKLTHKCVFMSFQQPQSQIAWQIPFLDISLIQQYRLSLQPLQMQIPVLKSNSKFVSHY
ncbi:hypothetical protein TTHERM_000002617 (macronuclear) [Tetrahymena thermophila SB210]|uniref:Uncharacterized protein n=1 Tax=Tetrahymena thermophila (strain SB210) TaxID=312017 RepID=W7XK91_TETTS|nr:hypothetical protein TTHERM_000002617 [Tetrahymena thermophila SB210]EWS76296.1 hypothetical protein TTHERM_000002617 [Tetrahymena thermophila SB210]|eukprot:XP_012651080.1 hypothetical protein TTHERM_000002617 [Tetrahymena thermophila SB210]